MVGDTVEFYTDRLHKKVQGFVVKTHVGALKNNGVGNTYNDSIDVTMTKKVPVGFGYVGAPDAWFCGENEVSIDTVCTTRVVLVEKDISYDFKWD
jgi:hypothetical protein